MTAVTATNNSFLNIVICEVRLITLADVYEDGRKKSSFFVELEQRSSLTNVGPLGRQVYVFIYFLTSESHTYTSVNKMLV